MAQTPLNPSTSPVLITAVIRLLNCDEFVEKSKTAKSGVFCGRHDYVLDPTTNEFVVSWSLTNVGSFKDQRALVHECIPAKKHFSKVLRFQPAAAAGAAVPYVSCVLDNAGYWGHATMTFRIPKASQPQTQPDLDFLRAQMQLLLVQLNMTKAVDFPTLPGPGGDWQP